MTYRRSNFRKSNFATEPEFVVREPTARGFGEWCGEGEAVVLIERMGMGDKGVEIKGRELVGSQR